MVAIKVLLFANLANNTNLKNTDLRSAWIGRSDLSDADLRYSELVKTNIGGANFSNVTFCRYKYPLELYVLPEEQKKSIKFVAVDEGA